MTIEMDDSTITTLEQVRKFLSGTATIRFQGASRSDKYKWIERTLARFDYFGLGKKERGTLRRYMLRMAGFSPAQLTRLIEKKRTLGEIKEAKGWRNVFERKYTRQDMELLAETDNLHERLSGPATRAILRRQYEVYKDPRFERLKDISSAHIYNLRSSRSYQLRAQTFTRTQSRQASIGVRRRPDPRGQPGYLRVDTVHQGDMDGKKGVYHINLIDEVTQWEIVVCVERISERYLLPVLDQALSMFPFRMLNFHSDNGSEFINGRVAEILNKLLIEQTKSRSGRTNDNALVEGKNGSIIRKHMGYWYIEQRYASKINRFYVGCFNTYLNYHRPCGFPTITVDGKGKRHKKYRSYQTPYERFKSLKKSDRYLRPGATFQQMDQVAQAMTDNQFAKVMQKAKERLFKELGEKGRTKLPNGGFFPELRRHHDDLFHAHS